MSKLKVYNDIKEDVIRCSKCDLGCDKGSRVVGNGNINADLMFIAEAPGKHEVKDGVCLSGNSISGKIYVNILNQLGYSRDDVFTANVICCGTNERKPEPWEIIKCRPYLERQLRLVSPKLVVTFGRLAAQAFFNDFKITKDHGKLFDIVGFDFKVFPIFHPAHYKAYSNKKQKDDFKKDIRRLKIIIDRLCNVE